jgi:hypothetical protein
MSTLPPELIERILYYVPQEMVYLNRTIQAIINNVFSPLEEAYRESPTIRRFMPLPHIARTMSTRAIVLRTAADIFRFGHMTSQPVLENFSSDHLQTILVCAERFFEQLPSHIPFWDAVAFSAARSGNLQDIRIASVNGEINALGRARRRGRETDDAIRNRRYRVAERACIRGDLSMVQELITRGVISDRFSRGLAVGDAAAYGHTPLVRVLLASGEVHPEHRAQACGRAIENGHLVTAAACEVSHRRISFGAAGIADFFISHIWGPND